MKKRFHITLVVLAVIALCHTIPLAQVQRPINVDTAEKTMPEKPFELSPDFDKATTNVLVAAKKELQAAAKAHGVRVNADQMMYASLNKVTIVHAPLIGVEKYKDEDFAAGASIQLILVKSTIRGDVPSGSYVVKAQYQLRATSGRAIFIDQTGAVVTQRELIIRTWKQSAVLFPEVYSDPGPQLIPVVTSTHIWHNNKWAVDCAGWIPYRVLYY